MKNDHENCLFKDVNNREDVNDDYDSEDTETDEEISSIGVQKKILPHSRINKIKKLLKRIYCRFMNILITYLYEVNTLVFNYNYYSLVKTN